MCYKGYIMLPFNSPTQTLIAFVTSLILVTCWIRWRIRRLKIFKELGIPGPTPHFIFGNILEIYKKGFLHCQEEWIKKYGQIVGYYHGLKPVLMVADKSVLKRIFIKDFHLFSDRPEVIPLRVHSVLDHIIPASQIMDSILLNQKGENWKRVRSILSPQFSSNKLKMMIPFVDKVSEATLSILEEKSRENETTNMYELLQYLTLDVICAQAFGVNIDSQKDKENHPLFRSAKNIFDTDLKSKIIIFGLCFPEAGVLGMALIFLKMFFANGFTIPPLKITNLIGDVVERRRKHPEMRRPDILQSLIDASESSESPDLQKSKVIRYSESDSINSHEKVDFLKSSGKLTLIELKANALVVFLAGYETTSSAVAYVIHMLAKYPKYQAEIQKEIDRNLENKDVDYYNLNNMQLLERFIMEALRFYSPAVNFSLRTAKVDVDFGHFVIPKGMEITVPVGYIHSSEDNWENPDVFDPDRFLERKTSSYAMSYWVFGNGPRNCLGMRLSNITAKIILVKMLQRFTFELPDNPEDATVRIQEKFSTMVPDKVLIKVKKRHRSVNVDI